MKGLLEEPVDDPAVPPGRGEIYAGPVPADPAVPVPETTAAPTPGIAAATCWANDSICWYVWALKGLTPLYFGTPSKA